MLKHIANILKRSKKKNTHTEQSNIPLDTSETHKVDYSNSSRTPIENTPFWLIEHDHKHFAVFSQYRITEIYDSAKEVMQALETEKWHIVMRMCIATHEQIAREATALFLNKNNTEEK